ncbi:hypothetical protein Tco_0733013 [Tanacetum coccineum]
MIDAGRDDGTQQTTYEQFKDDEHVILTTVHDTQKTEVPLQSSSVSSDFANQFLNLDNIPPTDTKVVFMMNVKVHHEEPSTQTLPLLNIYVMSIPTSTPAPTTSTTITLILALPDFSSLFGFDQRVSALEKELSQFKQADYSAQLLKTIKSQIPVMVDAQLSTRLKDSIKKSFKSYTAEFEKKAKDERKRYLDLVEKSVKDIIKDEVKSQLPQILPKEVSDYTTPLEKDLFKSYGKVYSLKRDREDKDKDEDPPSSSSKGTKSQPKSSGKSAQAEEPVFEAADTKMSLNQRDDLGNTDYQPNVEAASKDDSFKKPERPPTPDSDWNTTKAIDFRPPQTWISKIAKAEKPPITFDELMSTPIDFSAYE